MSLLSWNLAKGMIGGSDGVFYLFAITIVRLASAALDLEVR